MVCVAQVTGNIFVLSLTNINTISFANLTSVGGTVQITALQPHVTVTHVRFPVLARVGSDLILGGETSHFGTAMSGRSLGLRVFFYSRR